MTLPRPKLGWPIMLAFALVLMAPLLLWGERTQDSWKLDLVWAGQFTDQLATNPYPRWLERSFDGFGAPVFYFYPPLAFYACAIAHYATAGLLTTFQEIWIAATLALFASGLSMRAWLKEIGGRQWLALVFMVAPYHLFDIQVRGALAEFCAYAFVPLVMLALKRALDGKSPLPLALAYAALVTTHLPGALLTSALLMTPYALWRAGPKSPLPLAGRGLGVGVNPDAWEPEPPSPNPFPARGKGRWRTPDWPLAEGGTAKPATFATVLNAGAGIALGLALSAVYLVPALMLPMNQAQMYRPYFRVADLFFWNWHGSLLSVLAPQIMMAVFLLILGFGKRFWSLMTIALAAVLAGVLPILMLPILEKVQFPWRTLMLMEFCVVTKLALDQRAPGRIYALVYPVMLAAILFQPPIRESLAHHPEATEYLPSAAIGPETEPVGYPPLDYLRLPQRSEANGIVTLRKFNFPSWRSCRPIEGVLVSFPKGCAASIGVTAPERIGGWISLAAVFAWTAAAGLAVRRRKGWKPIAARVSAAA